jgi:tetratricopeptide (TPR) repeat protein
MNKYIRLSCVLSVGSCFFANAQTLQDAITKTENERFDAAAADFRQLIVKEPSKGDNFFYFGENYFKNGNIDSALIMYKKGTEVHPTNGLNFVGIGKALLVQGKEADANTNLFKAKTLGAKNANTLIELAEAYTTAPERLRKPDESITLLDNALKLEPKNAEAHIIKGDALEVLHPTESGPAIKEYEDAQKLNPKSPKAVLRQGKIWNRARNFPLAIEKYKEAIKIDPTFAPAYIEMAELYHRANQDNNALDAIKKYLDLNANNPYAHSRYASFLFESKQYPDCIKEIEDIQKKDTSDAYLYRLLGYAYDETGNKDTAAYSKGVKAINKFFQKTQGKDFKYIADDYKHKGSLLSKTGKDSLGVLELQKAIDLDPAKNCELYGDMGKIWMKAKKYDKAIVAYEKLPGCGKTLSGQNYYDLGRAYFYLAASKQKEKKDIESVELFVKADTSFSKLTQVSPPTYPVGYFWRGKTNVQLDLKNEKWLAKPFYEKAVEIVKPEERAANKNNIIEACSYLGYYYAKMKDNEKAKYYWGIVKELDPNNEKANAFFKNLTGK